MLSVDDILRIAEREWQSRRIAQSDRKQLAADLRADLEAAVADGVPAEDLVGPDVRAFARRLEDAAQAPRTPTEYGRLLRTSLFGALPGGIIAYLATFGLIPLRNLPNPPLAVVVYYGVPAVIAVVGSLVAVSIRMRDVVRVKRTVAAMGLLVPLTGAVVTPVTIGFAWLTDYSDSLPVVLLEMAMVASALTGAIVLARRWAIRSLAL